MKQSSMPKHLQFFIVKMEKEGLPQVVINTFAYYYKKVVAGETGLVFDKDIKPLNADEIESADNIGQYADAGKKVLKNAVMIMLNGGLGTTMGLTKPKSIIRAKNGKSFLEIVLKQAQASNVMLSLMNSFSTHQDTLSALARINPHSFPIIFIQHKFPKILGEGFGPATWPQNTDMEWNPPGHGDVYTALYTSETLQHLLDKGIIYAFIANSDNLGATMDASLLGYFAEHRFPFMMEVAERTPSDLKGGHIARHKNGNLILREAAQCPKDELDAFRDISRYRYFNTNNIWINLHFLLDLINKFGTIRLPMILNPKTLDPVDASTPEVYQVETAMGSAISLFEGATAICVPRSRFSPVKNCNDLLAVRSDCYILSKEQSLILNPERKLDEIKINLDPEYYGTGDFLNERFLIDGVPSLVDCESLTIKGDVRFEKDVIIKGNVIIMNAGKSQAVIKKGTVIDSNLTL
ncbi:MAG: UTP--glucose-1-phosphate uridylyltransferase [Deltaproteobacteria bacterium]|nr:UTP--glucose-1-phosphate uridylyltransferase [Deltaproteobacteria bacterium]MBW2661194.1 UTP--glucose-1-phosphate uridylyltransferase [Deltaproteobacteria bacterium]